MKKTHTKTRSRKFPITRSSQRIRGEACGKLPAGGCCRLVSDDQELAALAFLASNKKNSRRKQHGRQTAAGLAARAMMRIAIALACICTFASSPSAMVGGAPPANEDAAGAVGMLTGPH